MHIFSLIRASVLAVGMSVSPLTLGNVFNCNPVGSTQMTYGDAVNCTLDNAGDIDSFQFNGSDGDKVYINVAGTGAEDFNIRLYDPAGALRSTALGDPATIPDFLLDQDGVWTVLVAARNAGTTATDIPYQIDIPCLSGACIINTPPAGTAGYVPVAPCRIVNQRVVGVSPLQVGIPQSFLAYGTASELAPQGGIACPNPISGIAPVAIAANVTAVGELASGQGNIVAYPSGAPAPTSSLVNFRRGTNIANAAIIPLCEGALCTSDFDLKASFASIPAIVDVTGYFYKTP